MSARGQAGRAKRPRLVELIGPAGSGKTTLVCELSAHDPEVSSGPTTWGLPRRFQLASAIALVPTIVAAALSRHPLRAGEIGQMVRLGALRRATWRAARRGHGVLVLDEGPVFALAWLDVFFPRNGGRHRAAWQKKTLEAWAARLDGVVCIDADDRLLARRIKGRSQRHPVKDSPEPEIRGFTARYRAAFDRLLTELAAAGDVPVRSLRTDGLPPAEGAARLREAIRELRHGL